MFEFFSRFLKYPAVFFAAGALCFVALKLLGRCAARCGLLDRPRERHIHVVPVPKIGGLAIFAGFIGACALAYLGPRGSLPGSLGWRWGCDFMAIGGLYLLLGVADDRLELKPLQKLAGQILIAGIAYLLGIRFGKMLNVPVPFGLDVLATVVWFVAFVNAFNLIDGMDGVATGLALVGGIGLMILFVFYRQPVSVLVMLAMLGACSVFLRYNFHPARLYLGDAGSMLLGAFFAAVSLGSGTKSTTLASLGFPLLVAGVPLMDSGLAIWRRTLKRILSKNGAAAGDAFGNPVMAGDLEHLHHRLAAQGYSPRKVAIFLYGVSALLVGMGLVIIVRNSLAVGVAFISFVILVYLVVNHLATVELTLSGDAFVAGLHRPEMRTLSMVLYPAFDVVALLLGSALALALVRPLLETDLPLRLTWLHRAPVLVSVPMLLMFFSGVYGRLWSRARISEYVMAFAAAGAGCVAGMGVLLLSRGGSLRVAVLTTCLLVFFDGTLVVGARAMPRVIVDLLGWNRRRHRQKGAPRALIYGAGNRATLLLREMTYLRLGDQRPLHLLGLIDDNPAAWGRIMHGYKILGGLDELCRRMERGEVDEVTIACNLPESATQRVVAMAHQTGTKVERWGCAKVPLA